METTSRRMNFKTDLVKLARSMDFDVYDFAVINGIECVAKKFNDGSGYIYWPIEREGSGFTSLFKGFSKDINQDADIQVNS